MIKKNECYFDRETTNVIKGMLLIIMFILHFFLFPSWYVKRVEYPHLLFLEKFQGHFQICVAGFTFLTGYLYFYSTKNFKHVIKKWKNILIPYWIVFGILLIIACLTNTYTVHVKTFMLELFALERPVMFFCWYVPYYLIMIFLLWLLVDTINSDFIKWCVSLFGAYILYYGCLHFTNKDFIVEILEKFSVYFPITVTGFLCSKRNWFEKIDKLTNGSIIYSILFIVVVFMEPTWLYAVKIDNICFQLIIKCIRIMSIPLFIYGLIHLIKNINNKMVKSVLNAIGVNSMLMWFIHGIFFNCSKEIFQKILYFPKVPILVLVWGLILCWTVASLIGVFQDHFIHFVHIKKS